MSSALPYTPPRVIRIRRGGKEIPVSSPTNAFTVQQVEKFTIIEFRQPSLMDPVELESIGTSLYRLVDEEDKRKLVLDFERVTYPSSQAIGIVLTLHKKLGSLPH